mgnify:CR=1 FL=1
MSEFAPMDILGKKFSKKLHGYDALEVHEYLTDLARVVEGLLRERGELKQRVHHMEQELSAFRERESALKEALVAAQRSAETTIEVARAEGHGHHVIQVSATAASSTVPLGSPPSPLSTSLRTSAPIRASTSSRSGCASRSPSTRPPTAPRAARVRRPCH